eukprot:1274241-Pyramimonas_sp.AAC.1
MQQDTLERFLSERFSATAPAQANQKLTDIWGELTGVREHAINSPSPGTHDSAHKIMSAGGKGLTFSRQTQHGLL